MAVISPIRAMASPLTAPSTAPCSSARAVPSPWAEQPKASPREMGLCFPKTRITRDPKIAPMKPVNTTETAVSETFPPIASVTSMAIGVVTDLAAREA